VSRKTIYDKFEREELKPHIQKGDRGQILDEQGFGVLCAILGTSQVTINNVSSDKKETSEDTMYIGDKINCIEIEYLNKQIEYLEKQVEELRKEKEELKHEKNDIQSRLDGFINIFFEQQKSQLLLQQPTRKKFLGLF
jgi:predicted RNase H-like nuclease (RuvC/YqgF family)